MDLKDYITDYPVYWKEAPNHRALFTEIVKLSNDFWNNCKSPKPKVNIFHVKADTEGRIYVLDDVLLVGDDHVLLYVWLYPEWRKSWLKEGQVLNYVTRLLEERYKSYVENYHKRIEKAKRCKANSLDTGLYISRLQELERKINTINYERIGKPRYLEPRAVLQLAFYYPPTEWRVFNPRIGGLRNGGFSEKTKKLIDRLLNLEPKELKIALLDIVEEQYPKREKCKYNKKFIAEQLKVERNRL